ncbi:methyltransferase domain-containing protein [Endozoicomonas arenosclerae]|uniref:methyltransferase domain-containing protein n=1 Tax=Endozoicomonas arenosclerae TaxID=1633495 RepID=UPI000783A8C0|nr:methyltransferase domain-containing protein [Endozoicomonas arenosclerae]
MHPRFAFGQDSSERTRNTYLKPDIIQQRQYTLDRLNLKRGESVLDIGCGPGLLVSEMAKQTDLNGLITGIDPSLPMLEMAEKFCRDQSNTHFQQADAETLPFESASFDVAVSIQVLEYVSNVDQALLEIHRVLKPGGRALIIDTDWDSVVWNNSDRTRMLNALEIWQSHREDSFLPRKLPAKLRQARLGINNISIYPIINTRFSDQDYSYFLAKSICNHLSSKLPTAQINNWFQDLVSKEDKNDYFFSLNRYVFEITKN